MQTTRICLGLTRALAVLLIVFLGSACTHAFQTNNEALPQRMHLGEFSFDRPQGPGWYMSNVSDPPTIVEFTRHGHRSEAQIMVKGIRPEQRVTTPDELMEWAEATLPDQDKVVTAAPGHGATCVNYHGRSIMTVHYEESGKPFKNVMTTDEDSLDCIDPYNPGLMVRFISTQRSATGGTPDGTAEAYAFLKSIQFEK